MGNVTERYYGVLHDAQQGWQVFLRAWEYAKPLLIAGHKLTLAITPERRNAAQNALLHAMLTDISTAREWAGKKWDVEDWKRLLTAAWLRSRKEAAIFVPAIDGAGFDILYRRTSQLTKGECAELIDYITAWQAQTEAS